MENSKITDSSKPFFTPEEARVLASLMEKQLTVPKQYPLTPKALAQACNQKSSREPVMAMSEGEVRHVMNLLENRGLIKVDSGERTYRISHKAKQYFDLERNELSILTVLMLRAPQTLNDILRRTSRMCEISDTDEVQLLLEELMEKEMPLAVIFPHGSGQREARYSHTLCGEIAYEEVVDKASSSKVKKEDRMESLEQRLDTLEAKLEEIMKTMMD